MRRGNEERVKCRRCGHACLLGEASCPICGAPLPTENVKPISLADLDARGPQNVPDEYDLDSFDEPEPDLAVDGTFWADVEPNVAEQTLDSAKLEELTERIGPDVANNLPLPDEDSPRAQTQDETYRPYPLDSELGASEPREVVFPNFDLPPELPDFSQERDPAIELPDLDRAAADAIAPPQKIAIPNLGDPPDVDERPVRLSRRKFLKICRAPETRLVFIRTRIRYWAAAVLAECLFCPPCGVAAYRSFRRVFERLARTDFRGASEALETTRRRLLLGAGILGAAAALVVIGIAAKGNWSGVQWTDPVEVREAAQ